MAIYLKYEGIDGDATHEQHKKWLDIKRLTWGVGRAVTTPVGSAHNREASEPHVSEVSVTKTMDASSPKFFTEGCTGKQGKKVTIHLVTTGSPGDTYVEYILTNALVSGYNISTDGDRPVEHINLNFTKMEVKYVPYDANHKPQSPIVASYDLATTKSG